MKVQEMISRAMAKRITWWQAAEIISISARQIRRWHERTEAFGYDGLFDLSGDGRAVPGTVSGSPFRSERAASSREATPGASHRAELYLGEAGFARGRTGEARPPTWGAPQPASEAAIAVTPARRLPTMTRADDVPVSLPFRQQLEKTPRCLSYLPCKSLQKLSLRSVTKCWNCAVMGVTLAIVQVSFRARL